MVMTIKLYHDCMLSSFPLIAEQFVFFRKAELNFTYKYEIINTSMVDVAIVIQLLSNVSANVANCTPVYNIDDPFYVI